MSWFPAPKDIPTRVWARLPDALRAPRVCAWSRTNKAGAAIDSFLEGPCFDAQAGAAGEQVAHSAGWPNGLKMRADGTYLVTAYRRGLVQVDPLDGSVTE